MNMQRMMNIVTGVGVWVASSAIVLMAIGLVGKVLFTALKMGWNML